MSLPAVAQYCPSLTDKGEISADISFLCKMELGSKREKEAKKEKTEKERMVIHMLPPPLSEACVLERREYVRGGVIERWRKKGGLGGGKLKN